MTAKIQAYARPTRLYRYRALVDPASGETDAKLERELEAIASGYVYCPLYSDMNDPMEGSHRESALLKKSKHRDHSINAVRTALNEFGVASFSETKNHEPMWAYYAGNFAGICIEYNVTKLLKNLGEDCELVKMTYSEQPPLLLRNSETAENRAKMILSCKSLRWAGEREWRLIQATKGKAAYMKLDTVKAVFLGSRILPNHEAGIRARLRELGISVQKMKVDSYELGFEGVKRKVRLKR